jgi:hypothetical protein
MIAGRTASTGLIWRIWGTKRSPETIDSRDLPRRIPQGRVNSRWHGVTSGLRAAPPFASKPLQEGMTISNNRAQVLVRLALRGTIITQGEGRD